jgi:hypothetical protein
MRDNDQHAFSKSEMQLASIVVGNTIEQLVICAPKINSEYYENEGFVHQSSYNALKSKIDGFVDLNFNWDSYGADAISKIAASKAKEILRYLQFGRKKFSTLIINVFPMRDGGIQFEFDNENICAELEVNPLGEAVFLRYSVDGSLQDEKQLLELAELSTLLEDAEYAL